MQTKSIVKEYSVAVGTSLLAIVARLALDPSLNDYLPYLTFFIAVAVTTSYSGLGASLLAVVLGGLASNWFFMSPRHSLDIAGTGHQIGYAIYFIVSLSIVGFGQAWRWAQLHRDRGVRALSVSESAIRERLQELQTLYDTAPMGMCLLDKDLRYVRINNRLAEMNGLPAKDHIGKTVREMVPLLADELEPAFRRIIQTGEPVVGYELTGETSAEPNVRRTWLESWYPQRDAEGRIVGLNVMVQDVTDRKRAEDALRESEGRFTKFMHHLPGLAWIKDRTGRYVFANDAAERAFGMPKEQFYGKTDDDVFPPETAGQFKDNDTKVLLSAASVQAIESLRHSDGRHYSLIHKFPIPAEDGHMMVGGMAIDITEYHRAELALRESEARLRLFIQHAPVAIAMFDCEMRYLAVSRRWLKDYPVKEHDVIGRSHYDIYPEISERWKEFHARGLRGETLVEEADRFERLNGSVQWLHWQIHPWRTDAGEIGGIIIFAEDMTERKQAQEALCEGREELRRALEFEKAIMANMGEGLYTVDRDGLVTSMNPAAEELLGWTSAELLCRKMHEVTHFQHRDGTPFPADECPGLQVIRQGTVLKDHEDVFIRKDGTFFDVVYSSAPIHAGGTIIGLVVVFRDVSESKHLLKNLQESETRFRTLADSAPVLIWMNGPAGAEFVNRAYMEFLGVSHQIDVAQFDWAQYVHPDDRDGYVSAYLKTVERRGTFDAPFRFRRHDGEYRWMRSIATPRLSSNGDLLGYVGATFDVTDSKEAEAKLRSLSNQLEQLVEERTQELVHSQDRLRALATELNLAEQRERKRLAGELHDYLAQLLVLCRLNLGQVRRAGLPAKADETVKETEEVLNQALNYSRTLMAELSPPVLQEHGLPAGLKWLGEEMQRHGLAVTVDTGNTADLSLPDDNAVLLFQSVRELLINALKHAESKVVMVRLDKEGENLRIEVRDNGVGFDLTGAEVSNGTTAMSSRLGLFSIRERMRTLGGWFNLQSVPGQGTTAILTLPLGNVRMPSSEFKVPSSEFARAKISGPPSSIRSHSDNSEPTTQNSQLHEKHRIRVLLVDDHAMVRQGLRSVLDSYADIEVVGEAWNGEDAVAAVEALQPSVVLMDINMPKLNGIDATAKIKSRYPAIIVIGLSVNAGGENEAAMKKAGAALLLTKEAAVDELYRAIHAAMHQAVSASRGGE